MRTAMIWPGTPERVPCGMFTSKDQRHIVAAMTTDEHGVIVKLAAHCGASTTATATWTNLATVRSTGERICEACVKAAIGETRPAAPVMLPDHVLEKLRQQASAEERGLEEWVEKILAYRRRQNPMRIAASQRGKRKG